ncbi:MAG: hypothetical protein KF726_14505 [Anaerolineae bacterium]|nr:hypothetical protein [Anaerolineae bacterium]
MHKTINRLVAAALLLSSLVIAVPFTEVQAQGQETITLSDASIIPESITINPATGNYLVGSLTTGTIYEVAADGTTTPFIQDSELTTSSGITVADGKLFVVSSGLGSMIGRFRGGQGGGAGQGGFQGTPPADFTPPTGGGGFFGNLNSSIYLFVFDLNTKARLFKIDLTNVAPSTGALNIRFANDVAVDAQGNAYVTDSIAGAVYRVDPSGNPAYLSDPKFGIDLAGMIGGRFGGGGQGGQGGQTDQGTPAAPGAGAGGGFGGGFGGIGGFDNRLGLNGIVFDPSGYLLVDKSGEGKLFKIPLDNPANITEVTLPEPITGADGMRLTDDGKVVVISAQTVYILSSTDSFATASIDQKITVENGAVSAVIKDGSIYVLHSSFGGGRGAGQATPDPAQTPTPQITAATIVKVN